MSVATSILTKTITAAAETNKQTTKTDDKLSRSLNAKIIDCVLHGGAAVVFDVTYAHRVNSISPKFLALNPFEMEAHTHTPQKERKKKQ